MSLLCTARCRPGDLGPREASQNYRLCDPCRGWLARNLAQLVDLAPDLEAALSRSNTATGEKVAGTPGRTLELDQHVAAVRWQIHSDLVGTVRLVMSERGLIVAPQDDIAAMARWLGRHVDWLAAHESAGERADEAASWPSAARGAIHPNPPKRVQIGACPRQHCPGTLTAIVKPQDTLFPSAIECSWWKGLDEEARAQLVEDGTEPHIWGASQWHALGRQMARKAA